MDLLWACSDLVVIRYISCVGRRSILIAIPLSLVVCMPYNNRPGASGASLDSNPLLWEGFKLDWFALGFHGRG